MQEDPVSEEASESFLDVDSKVANNDGWGHREAIKTASVFSCLSFTTSVRMLTCPIYGENIALRCATLACPSTVNLAFETL